MNKKLFVYVVAFFFTLSSFVSFIGESIEQSNFEEECSLSGYVTDPFSNPIEGARVRISFHDTYEENYTDSNGYYYVSNIPICYCMKNASASKEGYSTEWILLSISENTTHDFVLTPLGDILYVGGSGPGNYSRIQDAIDNASDGDTVFVYDDSSPYYENIVVDKSVDLIGEERNTTIIDGSEMSSHHVVKVISDGVLISGFTVRFVGGTWSLAGIFLASQGNVISQNNIINNRNGIFLWDSSYNIISYNTIKDNGYHGIRLAESNNNNIIGNDISTNHAYGIYLWDSSSNIIIENTITKSFWEGIQIGYFSIDNAVYHNNLVENNLENAYDEWENTWDDGYPSGGNFWDDYNGEDNDGDGIGDTPYIIPGETSQDNYPLIEPFGQEYPELEFELTSGFGINIIIRNIGTRDFIDLDWSISIYGGLFGLINKHISETIPILPTGDEETISSGFLFGLGSITINIVIEKNESTTQGFIIGPFIIIQ